MAKVVLDFTNVEDSGSGYVKPGTYRARLLKVQAGKAKGGNQGPVFVTDWMILGPNKRLRKTLSLEPAALWKVRNMIVALGGKIEKKKTQIDTERLRGECALEIVDNQYNGKTTSDISEFISLIDYEAIRGSNGTEPTMQGATANLREVLDEIEGEEAEEGLDLSSDSDDDDEVELDDEEDLPF